MVGLIERMLRPTEVASRLGMAGNTLRVYSARFATLLRPPAARPGAGRGGRPGHRLYSPEDVAILARARDLVASGLTYEQALARLKTEVAALNPHVLEGGDGARAEDPAQAASLQQAVEAWRALAEERAREVAELRARVEALRTDLEQERSRRLAAEELIRLASTSPRGGKQGKASAQSGWLARIFTGEPDDRESST